jgi:hypothetical protein
MLLLLLLLLLLAVRGSRLAVGGSRFAVGGSRFADGHAEHSVRAIRALVPWCNQPMAAPLPQPSRAPSGRDGGRPAP